VSTLDRVFPPEHSDDEIGAAYEQRGLAGVLQVIKDRTDAGEDHDALAYDEDVYLAALLHAHYSGQDA
jgi:hypothetical protein